MTTYFRSVSLKTRISLLAAALVVAGIWGLALRVSAVLQSDIEKLLSDQLTATVNYIAADLDKIIELRFALLNELAAAITPDMLADPVKVQHLLEQRSASSTLFPTGITITNKAGINIADYPKFPGRAGGYLGDRGYFQEVMSGRKQVIGAPRIGRFVKQPLIPLVVPIRDAAGTPAAALIGPIDPADPHLFGRLEQTTIGKGGFLFVASPRDKLWVSSNDKSRIMQPLPAKGLNPVFDRRMEEGFEGVATTTTSFGVHILGASRKMNTTGWMVIAAVPTSEAFAPVAAIKNQIYLAALLMSLGVAAVLRLALGRQLAPLEEAKEAIQRMGDGEQPFAPLPVRREDEIGQLVRHFNRLVAERGAAEDKLRRFRAAIDVSADLVLLIDPATMLYVDVNETACRVLGYSREELLAMGPQDIFSETRESLTQLYDSLIAGGQSNLVAEGWYRRKDGSQFVVETIRCAVPLAQGHAIVAVARDITERKQAEAQRQALEAQLRQAQKMDAVGTLAGGIAHDFNNILGVIIGNVELARLDLGTEHPALESIDEIRKAGLRAKDLVNRILDFSSQQSQPRHVIALSPVVEEAVKLLRAALPAGIELAVTLAEDTPGVLADPTQMHQVIVNLGTNAWQAMEGKPGRVEIRVEGITLDAATARHGLQPGRYAHLSVHDSGHGIDAATQERIFEPFFTTKDVGSGTGLGLSVVHGIVEGHKGAILVESEPGRGTTFHLYFPAAGASANDVAAEPETAAPQQGRSQHVLYLDDEESLVLLVTRMLERLGYRVSGYTVAKQALEAVRADPGQFDLVVTDYNMPGMSGLDVASELMRIRPDLPVAVTSGYLSDDLRHKAAESGVRHLIYKPNTVEELCEAVHTLTSGTQR